MKKFLAMTLAAVMALSMAACSEKDDDEDEDKDDVSVSDSADKDSSKDDSSKAEKPTDDDSSEEEKPADDDSSEEEKPADDDSSEEEKPADDDSSEEEKPADDDSLEDEKPADDDTDDEKVDVEISEFTTGTLSDGVITAGNLKLTVGEGWTEDTMDGNTFFTPSDYWTTGNNLNIMITAADPYISLYTEDLISEMYAGTYSDFVMGGFEKTTINGFEAIEMSYSFSGMTFTQVMLSTDTESYVITFTGNTGDFADVASIIDTIEVK